MVNFATRLRLLGWEPHILTIPDSRVAQVDRARLQDVVGLPIHKAAVWPTAIGTITSLMKLRRGATPKPAAQPGQAAISANAAGEPITRRLRRYIFSFALLPDAEKGWVVPATLQAIRTIRRQRVDWFMTSCPPYSVHLVGLAVRKLTGARWIADFRDPWMTTGSKRLYPTSKASIAIESTLERHVVENADLVVFNVERLRNAYRERYSHVTPQKFVYIPNGVVSRSASSHPISKFGKFTIAYTGSLYVGRSPEPVFRALAQLIERGVAASSQVSVKLVGQCRFIDGRPTDDVVRQYGLQHIVDVHDPVPFSEAFEIVQRSHLALLLAPNLPYQVPAKVYDYLAADTRILAIAEDGGTADLLKETGAGLAFESQDVDGIAQFIHRELAADSVSTQRPLRLTRFDVQQLTEDLVRHLERVAQAGASGRV